MKSMKTFKNLFFIMLMALVLFVAAGCGETTEITLSFDKDSLELTVGDEKQLEFTVSDEEAELTWSSSDPTVVEVNETGLAKALKAGEATITVKVKDEDVSDTMTVTVKAEPVVKTKYPVIFITDGGSNIATLQIEEGSKVAKPKDPTKAGHVFAGWFTDEEKTEEYNFDTSVNAPLSLYAKWELAEYTITLDVDGGTEIEPIALKHGETPVKPEDPTKEGYTFKGWYTDAEFENLYYFNTAVTEDMTVYAKWELNIYRVQFSVDGGSVVVAQTLNHGDKAVEPTAPTKDKYVFVGWYTDTERTIEFDFDTPVTANLTLYAKWELDSYVVTFNTNGGSEVEPGLVDDGSTADKPANPTKEGFVFGAWFKDEALTELYNFNTPVTGDITLYAKWVAEEDTGTATLKWTYATKDDELTAFFYDYYTWLNSKGIIDASELTFEAFSGKDKTGTGLDTKFVGEWIKYTGLSGDALGLGTDYFAGAKNHLRLMGPVATAPYVIDDNYFLNSSEYNAKWAQYGIWIHNETKSHTNRFWSEVTGFHDLVRYVTLVNAGDSSYINKDRGLGEYSIEIVYHEYSDPTLPSVRKYGVPFVGWNTAADGSGTAYATLPVENAIDLELFAMFEEGEIVLEEGYYLVDQDLTALHGEVVSINGKFYKAGETVFSSITEVLALAQTGDTIVLREGVYNEELTLTVSGLTFTSLEGETAVITNKITLTEANNLTFKNLEFTGLAQITTPGQVDGFVFDNNTVYNSELTPSAYSPYTRADITAFIQFTRLDGSNIVGDVTITNNTFTNMPVDIISLARTTVGKTVTITDNEFLNFGVGVIRFDGGYNSGTYNILRNKFENDVLGASAAIVFRAYSAIQNEKQYINIENNTFKNIGDVDNQEPADTHPSSAVITGSIFNDQHVEFSIKNNVFEGNVNEIHLRNTGGTAETWIANINNNEFKGTQGYVYYETTDLANFNLNYYEDAEGVAITDLEVLAGLIQGNTNFEELWTKGE